ncbi:DUF937 domain-containing protein [Lichenihabitans sp. PAMC28606]|uniref:DUF937 domain-containing protein n=1 Tax=Lichenihabitans sp. PAMC28606 TaxID=2880932 RepID=UPI001D0A458A|nr:DUF937 domain-containing protein [Lichenihabitans sp. PAMC28606]UDL93777.1 DUF937 domain-containing protein [Lichenihabitans sp. PAMC28606]
MSLNDIIQSAQGGEAVNNLSSRFGLTPEQTQSAINALLPAFQMGLQNKMQGGAGGLGSILGQLGSSTHQGAFADAGTATSPTAVQAGSSVLGDLFGGQHASTQVAQQASAESGVSASVIQAMLPVLASIIMGGLFHSAQSGSWGGILSQVIGAAMGGQTGGLGGSLGSIFGQGSTANQGGAATPTQGQPTAQDSGLGGLIGSVLGGLLGGAGPQTAPRPSGYAPSAQADESVAETRSDTGMAPAGSTSEQAALNDLSQAFEAGTPASPQHQANLANILGRNG